MEGHSPLSAGVSLPITCPDGAALSTAAGIHSVSFCPSPPAFVTIYFFTLFVAMLPSAHNTDTKARIPSSQTDFSLCQSTLLWSQLLPSHLSSIAQCRLLLAPERWL